MLLVTVLCGHCYDVERAVSAVRTVLCGHCRDTERAVSAVRN